MNKMQNIEQLEVGDLLLNINVCNSWQKTSIREKLGVIDITARDITFYNFTVNKFSTKPKNQVEQSLELINAHSLVKCKILKNKLSKEQIEALKILYG